MSSQFPYWDPGEATAFALGHFADLEQVVQDDIIARIEHAL